MRIGFKASMLVAATIAAGLLISRVPSKGQARGAAPASAPPAAQASYRAPRTADGKPNLNGIWQALNEANWDLEPHAASMGPVSALGAQFSIPAGIGEHARLDDHSIIGGQGGVLNGKHIHGGEVLWGTPVRPLKEFLLQQAHLARLTKKSR